MNRLLYLYPEEWTGRRAREVHTLSTCVALARTGWNVVLVTAGGKTALQAHAREVAGADTVAGLELIALSRAVGPIRSAAIFAFHFRRWLGTQAPFSQAFVIHLKATGMLARAGVSYAFEAHEVFAETPHGNETAQRALENLERAALVGATHRVATSAALAEALRARYKLPDDFAIVPNAGQPPLAASVVQPDGPFVYCGSIVDWKGLEMVIEAARFALVPLRIVGGTEAEWRAVSERCNVRDVSWQPRVALADIPAALAGSRAGLIPTLLESGSGRYSCPMKLFDYARCGLPVVSAALPALDSLNVGSWCTRVVRPNLATWTVALRHFLSDDLRGEAVLRWAAEHTWDARARELNRVFEAGSKRQA
jgi:glycosyltransferase involved in cell wall biosynthesis